MGPPAAPRSSSSPRSSLDGGGGAGPHGAYHDGGPGAGGSDDGRSCSCAGSGSQSGSRSRSRSGHQSAPHDDRRNAGGDGGGARWVIVRQLPEQARGFSWFRRFGNLGGMKGAEMHGVQGARWALLECEDEEVAVSLASAMEKFEKEDWRLRADAVRTEDSAEACRRMADWEKQQLQGEARRDERPSVRLDERRDDRREDGRRTADNPRPSTSAQAHSRDRGAHRDDGRSYDDRGSHAYAGRSSATVVAAPDRNHQEGDRRREHRPEERRDNRGDGRYPHENRDHKGGANAHQDYDRRDANRPDDRRHERHNDGDQDRDKRPVGNHRSPARRDDDRRGGQAHGPPGGRDERRPEDRGRGNGRDARETAGWRDGDTRERDHHNRHDRVSNNPTVDIDRLEKDSQKALARADELRTRAVESAREAAMKVGEAETARNVARARLEEAKNLASIASKMGEEAEALKQTAQKHETDAAEAAQKADQAQSSWAKAKTEADRLRQTYRASDSKHQADTGDRGRGGGRGDSDRGHAGDRRR